jgi:GNAT superfamily N-acetyltransferase
MNMSSSSSSSSAVQSDMASSSTVAAVANEELSRKRSREPQPGAGRGSADTTTCVSPDDTKTTTMTGTGTGTTITSSPTKRAKISNTTEASSTGTQQQHQHQHLPPALVAEQVGKFSDVYCRVVSNDQCTASAQDLVDLVNVRAVFSRQLPKMPRHYIVRLMFDKRHWSLCLKRRLAHSSMRSEHRDTQNHTSTSGSVGVTEDHDRDGDETDFEACQDPVLGGICFRPFPELKFAEIAFLAVASEHQVRGYGTLLMNHLKEYCKTRGIEYFLTYADNFAVGYFRKQGFTPPTMPQERFRGFIKDYDGGTLMECRITPNIDYLNVKAMIHAQRLAVERSVRSLSNSHIVHAGYDFDKIQQLKPGDIAGIAESAWKPSESEETAELTQPTEAMAFRARLHMILKPLMTCRDAWPFLKAVDQKQHPTYYQVIKKPMDLSTMNRRVERSMYKSFQQFNRDFMLIITNCKAFNLPGSVYAKCAESLRLKYEQHASDLIAALEAYLKQEAEAAAAAVAANATATACTKTRIANSASVTSK